MSKIKKILDDSGEFRWRKLRRVCTPLAVCKHNLQIPNSSNSERTGRTLNKRFWREILSAKNIQKRQPRGWVHFHGLTIDPHKIKLWRNLRARWKASSGCHSEGFMIPIWKKIVSVYFISSAKLYERLLIYAKKIERPSKICES